MADDTVGGLHVTHLGWAVVAFSAIGVSQPVMEIDHRVALLADIGKVRKGLNSGGSCCNNAYTFSVTGKALSTHSGIVIIGQITRTRISKGMTYHTVSWLYSSSMPMTLAAISMPWIIM
jgi:hypothetical protein